MRMLKRIKQLIKTVLNNTKGEYSFRIEPSEFTPEQSASFDRMVDFLADMIEKYGDKIPKGEAEAIKQPNKKTA